MKDFLFSFVMPAYNVEQYLAEAVESVIAQTVGFEENIQIVLVNDGSTDGTGVICERYRDRYPDNIIYINKPNGGVSSARNAGLKHATGRYINFLDADDKWDANVCEAALAFFREHPDVNIVCFPIFFFERLTGGHWLNYKFRETRIANILTDWDYALFAVFSCFIENKLAKHAEPFEQRLSIAEDLLWMVRVLLDEQNFGVISKPCYRYRKRFDQNSAQDVNLSNLSRYLDTPRLCHLEILRYAKDKYGELPPWAQYSVMLDLTWRFKEEDNSFLTPAQKDEYRDLLRSCLVQIDDEIICSVRNLEPEERLRALALKCGIPSSREQRTKSGVLHDAALPEAGKRSSGMVFPYIRVEFMEIQRDRLRLRGACLIPTPYDHAAFAFVAQPSNGGGREYPCILTHCADLGNRPYFEKDLWARHNFEASLPVPDGEHGGITVQARLTVDRRHFEPVWLHGKQSPFVRGNAAAYLARAGHIVSNLPNGRGLLLERAAPVRVCRRELAFLRQVATQTGRYAQTHTAMLAGSVVPGFVSKLSLIPALVACARLAAWLVRRLSRKPIWLISDRIAFAGDNGEALFEYLMSAPQARRGIRPIFLLSRSSVDWNRLKRLGPTVAYNSYPHWLFFLAADKIVSSAADEIVINPFGSGDWLFRNLFNFDFVFLQHGVTLHDQTRWLNRANKNIGLFVTASERERQSIVEGDYGYTADQVALTGFPRHDKLLRRASGKKVQPLVAVMPTWREKLSVARDPNTTLSLPNPVFTQSGYFQFWNGLINHPRLLATLRGQGYRLRFVIHPQLTRESDKFQAQSPAEVISHCDYSQTFCEAVLLLTDYSSVAFDFALLKKPVVYAKFDYDTFYSGHIYEKGYFDYERDGFGPVCGDLESVVDAVARYLENDCEMESMYRERVDAFFGKQPENRCQAVVDAIKRLGRR